MMIILVLMIREMIERSGAYTREEPVTSIGKTITEVENINSMKIFKWARSSLSFTVCNCRMTKRTWSTGWLTGSLVLHHPHPRFKDLYFSNHRNHRHHRHHHNHRTIIRSLRLLNQELLERVRRKGKGEDNAADTFAARELSPTPTLFHHHYHNRLDADLIFVKEWMRALDKTRSQVKFFQCIFEALFIPLMHCS